jgi:hypothetical protein
MSFRRCLTLSLIGFSLLLPTACGSGPAPDQERAVGQEQAAETAGDVDSPDPQIGGTAPGQGGPILSGNNRFELRYASDLDPIMINNLHSWVVNLRTTEGEAVENASIKVDGDMPAHGHGLATQPMVSEELGGGDYRIEGLKFQMAGYWEIYLDILTAEGEADSFIIPVDIQ